MVLPESILAADIIVGDFREARKHWDGRVCVLYSKAAHGYSTAITIELLQGKEGSSASRLYLKRLSEYKDQSQ